MGSRRVFAEKFRVSGFVVGGLNICRRLNTARVGLVYLLFGFTLALGEPVLAQAVDEGLLDPSSQLESISPSSEDDLTSSDFVLAPIPIGNPTFGNGLGLAGAYLFKADPSSQDSYLGIGGAYTSNRSWGAGAASSLNFASSKYRLETAIGYGELNYDFYGIGFGAGKSGVQIPLKQELIGASTKVRAKVAQNFFLGPEFWYFRVNSSVSLGELPENFDDVSLPELSVENFGTGLLASFETVDNTFFPTSGLHIEARTALGKSRFLEVSSSNAEYSKSEVTLRHYKSLGANAVLATQLYGCRTGKQPPLFDLCLFGSKNNLRGYEAGRYRDRAMLTIQSEYRRKLSPRVGLALFGGIGTIGPSFSEFSQDQLLPSIGGGLRYSVSQQYKVDFAFDIAFGREDEAIYFRLGQAF